MLKCLGLFSAARVKSPVRPSSSIKIGGVQLRALFDTGSTVTLCHARYLPAMTNLYEGNRSSGPAPRLTSANGSPLNVVATRVMDVQLSPKRNCRHSIYFVRNLQVPAIIGMDFMGKNGVVIDTAKQKIRLPSLSEHKERPHVEAGELQNHQVMVVTNKDITIPPMEESKVTFTIPKDLEEHGKKLFVSNESMHDELIFLDGVVGSFKGSASTVVLNKSGRSISLPKNSKIGFIDNDPSLLFENHHQVFTVNKDRIELTGTHHLQNIDLTHVPPNFIPKYKSLLSQYADVFSRHDLDIGHSKTLPHEVRLTDPNRVVSINQYRLPYHLKEVAIDYVDKLLRSGVVRPSTSVFNSPLMLVKKPNVSCDKPLREQYRLVHNYVELNKSITPCSYPLRHLYELLDEVAGGKIFSVLDLSQGFFQQTLKDPMEATSFSIPGYGQFTYNRSPQGLNSSPAYFQRLLDFVLKGISRCYVYIDDIVISVNTHDENLNTLEKVFAQFRLHGLKIKPSKCHIGTGNISYLGYEVTAGKGIQPGRAKTIAVENFPAPKTIKEIRAFIGLTSFFRRAIQNYSLISAPLNKLVRKDSGYKSGLLPPEALKSFHKLKSNLISRPCLAAVDFKKRFFVTTDASETHYGSCLSQQGDDGIERPVGFSSKLLNAKETKQQPGMRERAALLYALRHWHPYLIGKEFTLRTDHNPNTRNFRIYAIQDGISQW